MSRTYSMLCKDCKESIWIAQGWPKEPKGLVFYSGMPKLMKLFKDFLFRHEDHDPTFIDSEKLNYIDDVIEIDEDGIIETESV